MVRPALVVTPTLAFAACVPWLVGKMHAVPGLDTAAPVWFWDLRAYDQHRVLQLCTLTMCCLIGLLQPRWLILGLRAIKREYRWTLAAFLLLGLVSAGLAPRPPFAMLEIVLRLLLFCIMLQIAGWRTKDAQADQVILAIILISAVGHLLTFYPSYFSSLHWAPLQLDVHMFQGYGNIRHFNHYQTLLAPILLTACYRFPASRPWAAGMALVCALWFALIFGSGARATLLALSIALLLAVLVLGGRGRSIAKWALGTAGLGVVSYLLCFHLVPYLIWGVPATSIGIARSGITGRAALWEQALHLAASSPWLGVGPMHFAYFKSSTHPGPHNASLQLLSEWGIPAAVIIHAVIGVALVRYWRHIVRMPLGNGSKSWLDVALWTSLVAACVDAQFSESLNHPYMQMWLAILCGWALGRVRSGTLPDDNAVVHSWTYGVSARLLPALLAGCIWFIVWPAPKDLQVMYVRNQGALAAVTSGDRFAFRYRFWRQGWIIPGTWQAIEADTTDDN